MSKAAPALRRPDDVLIVSAVRTPIGNFGGSLADFSAAQLGSVVLGEALRRANVAPEAVAEVLMGQVLTAACGQNPARQASLGAGLPNSVPAMTLNRVCGSGLEAVLRGAMQLRSGDGSLILAGGQESMSQAPHAMHLRNGTKMGDAKLRDTMIVDGLWDCFHDYHMGITAENVAKQFGLTREAQDAYAFESQSRAAAALAAGHFAAETVAVSIPQKKGEPVSFAVDEFPRLTPLEKLAALKPAFDKNGTVTAANASGLNDGAAAVLLATRAEAETRGLPILARLVAGAVAGVAPEVMGTGPIPASEKALARAGWTVGDLDLIEANEAFAAQSLAVMQGLKLPADRTNVLGGAIALGHPIGASGARVLVTLLHNLIRTGGKRGLVTLCIGGGQGVAALIERE